VCDTAITINTLYRSTHRLYSTDHTHAYIHARTWIPVLIQLVCYLLLYSGNRFESRQHNGALAYVINASQMVSLTVTNNIKGDMRM